MHTWDPAEYSLNLADAEFGEIAERAFDLVWRFDFAAPGFCVLDLGAGVDSHTQRSMMVDLKAHLSKICVQRRGPHFTFASLARFDQQETTKFHLDGAPAQSMLVLGYEPSSVVSRLFLADCTQAAYDLGITPQQFLRDYNPMYRRGDELLARYVTELPQPQDGHARIVLINNSSLPYTEKRTNSLGVMHKAIIVTPNASERRIVNSAMLVVDGDEIDLDRQNEFVMTDKISKQDY
jgi:hypothetical protein